MPTTEDEKLIEGVARGDARALRALYDRHAPLLFALAARVIGDASDAEDVIEEAFVEIWRRAQAYEPRGRPMAWLLALVRRHALERLRARRQTARIAPPTADSLGELSALAPEDRRVLQLAFLEGMTAREIADLLGENMNDVKARIARVVEKLS
jgi:RNA polymerase sigma-70 factor (ECF subfamily)